MGGSLEIFNLACRDRKNHDSKHVTRSYAFSPPRSLSVGMPADSRLDTEYDRANVPPYNGNDPPPAPGSLKRSLFPTLLNEVQNKGTQGVRARYGAELPPIISIVQYPGRPVILVPDRREKKIEFVREFAVKYFRIVPERDSTQQNKA